MKTVLDELNDKIIKNLTDGQEMRDRLIKLLESQVEDQKTIIKNQKFQLEIMAARIELRDMR